MNAVMQSCNEWTYLLHCTIDGVTAAATTTRLLQLQMWLLLLLLLLLLPPLLLLRTATIAAAAALLLLLMLLLLMRSLFFFFFFFFSRFSFCETLMFMCMSCTTLRYRVSKPPAVFIFVVFLHNSQPRLFSTC